MNLEFPIVDASEKSLTRAQKKNMKKKQKKKESKQTDFAFEIEEVICPMEQVKISPENEEGVCSTLATSQAQAKEPVEATKKKLRTLKKKLKQIEELEGRLESGEITPNKEQLNKISKKKEVLEEIDSITGIL